MNILMVGLSNSGKTTFLAALYELVRSDPPLPGALRQEREPDEREYFHEIGQMWLRLERLTHTNTDRPRHAELHLQTEAGEQFELTSPDISGEDFNHAWEGDPWPEEVVEIAAAADGILIFVRRDDLVRPLLLPAADAKVEEAKEWSAASAPTQTKLADLLESLDSLAPRRPPLALVVSAWDARREEAEVRPDQWLKLRLPLLWQMLESGREERPYSAFGVSAQGGDVTDQSERERLAKIEPPSRRSFVVAGDVKSADISAPISWLRSQLN
jgi:hypothetical protein